MTTQQEVRRALDRAMAIWYRGDSTEAQRATLREGGYLHSPRYAPGSLYHHEQASAKGARAVARFYRDNPALGHVDSDLWPITESLASKVTL